MLQLFIGNKNYSSWSMRPWVLMRQLDLPFEEVMVRFDSFAAQSVFKTRVLGVNPVGKVPVLVDAGFAVWDTLAIVEYLAEKFPDRGVWPADVRQRARARSVCAEMHAGFGALRSHCPMNIEAALPDVGQRVWAEHPSVQQDVARLTQMWEQLLDASGQNHMLMGAFSAVDAYYAPVVMRLRTYALPVSARVQAYIERLCAQPGVKAWIDGALQEKDFLDFEEPYRKQP